MWSPSSLGLLPHLCGLVSATWYQDMEEGGAGGKVPGGSAVEAAVMTSTPSLSAAGEYWC